MGFSENLLPATQTNPSPPVRIARPPRPVSRGVPAELHHDPSILGVWMGWWFKNPNRKHKKKYFEKNGLSCRCLPSWYYAIGFKLFKLKHTGFKWLLSCDSDSYQNGSLSLGVPSPHGCTCRASIGNITQPYVTYVTATVPLYHGHRKCTSSFWLPYMKWFTFTTLTRLTKSHLARRKFGLLHPLLTSRVRLTGRGKSRPLGKRLDLWYKISTNRL